MKKIAVLGSTGSIGRQTLEIVRAFPQYLDVVALAGGKNVSLLEEQITEFKPILFFSEEINGLQNRTGTEYISLEGMAAHPDVELVVVATAGKAGLGPTLAAIKAGKTIALANKEVLVMAGEIVMAEARSNRVDILPVDSEHSAIWQCLYGEEQKSISKLVLTASGGPFRSKSLSELAAVTPEEALDHPTWQMGTKVTIDSSTLMNKGMEIIEAHWLFGVAFSQIEVVVHPQSIIHSFAEFVDGSIKAQLSMPDMRLPIQCALSYPERWEGHYHAELDFREVGTFNFEAPDLDRFPALRLAMEVGNKGGTYPAVLSAADEVAVDLFLQKKIGFLDITRVIEDTIGRHTGISNPSLDDILAADSWAREVANGWCSV